MSERGRLCLCPGRAEGWQDTGLQGFIFRLSLWAANKGLGRPRLHQTPPPGPGLGGPRGNTQAWSLDLLHPALQLCPLHLSFTFLHLQMKTLISQGLVGPGGSAALKSPCQGLRDQSHNNRKAGQ